MEMKLSIISIEKLPTIDYFFSSKDSFYQYSLPSNNSVTVENYLAPYGRVINIYFSPHDKLGALIKISFQAKEDGWKCQHEYISNYNKTGMTEEVYFGIADYKYCDRTFLINFMKEYDDFFEWFIWNMVDKI
jgi:hypothetical protein